MCWRNRAIPVVLLAAAAAGCAGPHGAAYLTPARGHWERIGPVVFYTSENLYDLINGEADFVKAFGFRGLAQGTYRDPAGTEAVVDIYDMGTPSSAFALFRSHATVDAPVLDIGAEGTSDEARVEFRQGRYYVDVAIPEPEHAEKVTALARDIAFDMPAGAAVPAFLQLLPAQDRVARSEKYLPADFMGYPFLRRAVSAVYDLGSRQVRLFVCRYDDAARAAAALEQFRAVLGKDKPCAPLDRGDGGAVGEIPYVGTAAVFRAGRYLGGISGYAGEKPDAALLARLETILRSRRSSG